MSAEQFDRGVQIEAALEKHGEDVEKLDDKVSEYGQTLESYRLEQASLEDVEEAVEEVVQIFHGLFDSQNWLGEVTGEITGKKVDSDYKKFTAYRGLVCAADQIDKEQDNPVAGPSISKGTEALSEESETLIETWQEMLDVYEEAVEHEDTAQQISLEIGREQEGLDPYAFETPFQALEGAYDRVSELNQCVNLDYR